MPSRTLILPAALGACGGGALARRRLLRWGASDDEVRDPYPGAGIIPGGRRGATMATTLAAPPAAVWPWLVQMGCDRAGWYSWDRLDNAGHPSAEAIHPEWQDVAVGDRMASRPDGSIWFEVADLQAPHFLALRATFDLRGRPLDPRGPRPRTFTDSVWCFDLRETPAGHTRLVVSGYADARPKRPQRVLGVLVWEPAHWIMQTRQFRSLQRRVSRGARSPQAVRGEPRMAPGDPAPTVRR